MTTPKKPARTEQEEKVYRTPILTCPLCDGPLVDTSNRGSETPPRLCERDSRLFWLEELTPRAREYHRSKLRDFGDPTEETDFLMLDILVERDKARKAKGVK